MKKLSIVLSLVLSSASAFAGPGQKAGFASHVSLGPVVSMGHSWVSNVGGNRDFKFAPAAGIGMVYSRNEHLGFGAQLLVSHEGFKQETVLPNDATFDMTVNPVYLRMPLHLIYFFGSYGDRVRPKIYAGPSLALKVDETRHYNNEYLRPNEGSPAATSFNRFDAGLTAGAGANVRLNRATWLNLDAGYYHGLVDAITTSGANDFNGNRNLRLNVGLMWGL